VRAVEDILILGLKSLSLVVVVGFEVGEGKKIDLV
jgi:hypothetical protein